MIRHNLADQVLHLLALQNHRFRQFSFEQECQRTRAVADPRRENLFIAGMARAGSTALLNVLFASGQFAATTYAQMPFVLAPSLAARIALFRRSNVATLERAHGDGIRISIESPEALDGIFWSTFLPRKTTDIRPTEVPESILQKYAIFIENQLACSSEHRYLCKMNQGIDKLESIADFFSRSLILIPFREPLQQAASLLRQHRRFSNLSWYEQRYLDWQQHHEFGDLHRGFPIDENQSMPDTLNYWLQQWQQVYQYLSDLCQRSNNLLLLSYESLATSAQPWRHLEKKLGLGLETESFINSNRDNPNKNETFDPELHDVCKQLYADLCTQSEARLC